MSSSPPDFEIPLSEKIHQEREDVIRGILEFVVTKNAASRMAKDLLDRFGTLAAITTAPLYELREVANAAPNSLKIFKMARRFGLVLSLEPLVNKPVLRDRLQLYTYLRQEFAGANREMTRLLMLDGTGRLLADVPHTIGTMNFVPICARDVIFEAIRWHAYSMIIVHNHPGHSKGPTPDDVAITELLEDKLKEVGVSLIDSVIVTDDACLSIVRGNQTDLLDGSQMSRQELA